LAPGKYPQVQEHVRGQGRTPAGTHVPIMVGEVLAALQPQPGEIVADCTLGYGGHAEEFLKRIGPAGRLVGFDLDAIQLERTGTRLAGLAVPLSLHHSNFAGLGNALATEGIEGYDIIFADLGVSSMQIDDPSRGFSYKHDGPLDMRMDPRRKRTAADLVNSLPEEDLSQALADLADEPDHEQIAAAIVRQRQRRPIRTTFDLVDLVLGVKGLTRRKWSQRPGEQQRDLHPAARTFQALRILVNDELGNLKQLLRIAPFCLKTGGRMGILTFHSGEERLIERALAAGSADGTYAAISAEALRPSPQEVEANPRARPARLRWARKG
jgi:16S rRNA (cytosine1402-N4)-methyltransferase